MTKKLVALLLVLSLLIVGMAGCTTKENGKSGSDTITISIGNWPKQANPTELKRYNDMRDRFMAQYPNIKIVPDEWGFDIDTYLPKASSGQLPTMYNVFFTEVDRIASSQYAADLTDAMAQYGYTERMKPQILDLVKKDNKTYMVPTAAYVMGLYTNLELFKQAGLIDGSGAPILPKTFDELAVTAKKIKDKTGKAGFILPSIKNAGGWHFMNIAWAFGTQFMKKENGKWIATFNSDECAAALQYVKDLRWKYDVLPANTFIDIPEMQKLFATNQGAMYFAPPPQDALVATYSMSKDNIGIGLIPAGPAGQFSLMGGTLKVIRSDATKDEIDACFKWLEATGNSHNLTDESRIAIENNYKTMSENKQPIGVEPFNIWNKATTLDFQREMRQKYNNVSLTNFATFTNFNNVTIHPEEAINCQELYQTIEGCIQAVMTDPKADPKALLEQAAKDFQSNYLNRAK